MFDELGPVPFHKMSSIRLDLFWSGWTIMKDLSCSSLLLTFYVKLCNIILLFLNKFCFTASTIKNLNHRHQCTGNIFVIMTRTQRTECLTG